MAGHWNRAIFTPQWIIGRLTEDKRIGLEIQLGSPELPIRITFEELVLTVTASRLQVSVKRCDDVLLQRALKVVQRVLMDLTHTPMSAVGINFRFQCDAPEGRLLEVFNLRDLPNLSDDLVVQRTTINRSLKLKEQDINLTLTFEGGKAGIDFNFHRAATTAADALKALEADPIALKNTAIKILQDVYEATIESEENHGT